ncbi:Rieske 2Fe-2S domain-containing protein [Neisseriaceae bacterium PsAf]|nr:Rieske 2Fe-2S domain-containing protein [Neisseriaceae bacterium PsAf]
MAWKTVCQTSDIKNDIPKYKKIDGVELAIYTVDGEYYALEDVCPHGRAYLHEGIVDGDTVECPMHDALFNITTGEWLDGPGCRNFISYPV